MPNLNDLAPAERPHLACCTTPAEAPIGEVRYCPHGRVQEAVKPLIRPPGSPLGTLVWVDISQLFRPADYAKARYLLERDAHLGELTVLPPDDSRDQGQKALR